MTLVHLWDMLKTAWQEWNTDNAPRLGAALAYYTLFSLAPLLVILIAIAALVFGREAAQGRIVGEIQGVVGTASAQAIQAMIDKARQPTTGIVATVISVITLLLGATGVVSELKATLNTIWNVRPPTLGLWGTVKARLLSLAWVLGLGFLLLVSLVVSAILSGMSAWVSHMISSPWLIYFWQVVNFIVSLGVITVVFAMLYRFVPDTVIPWRDVWVGAAITAVLFVISKTLIGIYLGQSSLGSSYGPAGAVVLILVWVYYAALVFLFGAELTEVYAHRHGSRVSASASPEPPRAGRQSRPASPAPARVSRPVRALAVPRAGVPTASSVQRPGAARPTYYPSMGAALTIALGVLVWGVRRRVRTP
ncbi:MAG: YihY/virulence factor BrkB family protein [Candidatus Tectimicrobiota bacterium]